MPPEPRPCQWYSFSGDATLNEMGHSQLSSGYDAALQGDCFAVQHAAYKVGIVPAMFQDASL